MYRAGHGPFGPERLVDVTCNEPASHHPIVRLPLPRQCRIQRSAQPYSRLRCSRRQRRYAPRARGRASGTAAGWPWLDLPSRRGGGWAACIFEPRPRAIQRPIYVSYALSFVVLAVFWYGNHHLFRYIERHDTLLIVLNFAVLLLVAVQPFPTALLAHYDNDPVATTVYAAFFAANGIFSCALHWYSTRHHRLINAALGSRLIRNMVLRSVIAPALFLFSHSSRFLESGGGKTNLAAHTDGYVSDRRSRAFRGVTSSAAYMPQLEHPHIQMRICRRSASLARWVPTAPAAPDGNLQV